MTNPRKVGLVNRAFAVVGVLIVAVLAWRFATGSPVAGRLLVGGAGLAAGYGPVHLASAAFGTPRTPRRRLAWTAAMAGVVGASWVARVAVGEGPSTRASSTPKLLADGFLFGTALGALVHLCAPPAGGKAPRTRPKPSPCPYSPECVEGVFSEVRIHDPAYFGVSGMPRGLGVIDRP